MSYKGKFVPKNKSKYRGNWNNIIYRSLWELKFMVYLDENPHVIEWQSEEFCIPYLHPLDEKLHRYFPDFWVKTRDSEGRELVRVIEVKPRKEIDQPTKRKKVTKAYIREVVTYSINQAKWDAARDYCHDRGWIFETFDEKDLGIA